MNEMPRGVTPAKSTYALIIGIGQYRDPSIPRLKFTHADAKSLYELLLSPQRAGLLKENSKLLLDEQATLFNIKDAISGWLFKTATPDSTVLVYFAGHGGQESDKTGTEADGIAKYLLPWDADIDNLFASALSNSEFNRLLSTIKAKRRVIFMDACYAAGVTQGGARDLGIVGNPFSRLAEGEGRIVIASAKPNQRSWEDPGLGHGIFTFHLIDALHGKADADNDGYVSIMEIFKYLEQNVPQSVRHLANSVQEPLLCGDISKDIILTADAKRIAELAAQHAEKERRNKEEMQAKRGKLFNLYNNGDLPLDVYQEALALIEKSPREMTPNESKLAKNLDALLKDGISSEVYLGNRDSIRSEPGQKLSDRSSTQEVPSNTEKSSPGPLKTDKRYCIHCGMLLHPQNTYCIGCGSKIRS